MDPAAPAVELRHLTFTYPGESEPIFKDLSFALQPGSRCLLVRILLLLPRCSTIVLHKLGANGAGKSTLLRLLAGLHMIPETAVLVHGHSAFHDTHFSNNNVAFLGDVWARTVPWVGHGGAAKTIFKPSLI